MRYSRRVNGVGLTSLWVAAMRAVESDRDDALFKDPFARRLAGERGFEVFRAMEDPRRPPTIVIRTKLIDDHIRPARQVVILAAGMDARAFRLAWPEGTVLYEVDQPEALAYKRERLGDAAARCDRREIPIDLTADWPSKLVGFDAAKPTLWIAEGLLPYLRADDVTSLFASIDTLSAPGSVALFDCMNRAVLESPFTKPLVEAIARLGAPWQFGIDRPEALLPEGWTTHVHDIAATGKALGRWPLPVMPRGAPGVPQNFIVEARKD
jgi:methyltransferase (TIGR00027 family)